MSAPPPTDRKVIPRWRSYDVTRLTGELRPLAGEADRAWTKRTEGLDLLAEDFRVAPSGPVAGDLVGAALVLGPTEPALEAARMLADGELPSTATSRGVALRILGESEEAGGDSDEALLESSPDHRRGELRRQLALAPFNALRWADLARLYTINGDRCRARRAMQAALGLAPSDRYVLRSAARLAIHHHEYERAHFILSRAPRTRHDPWLLAAEIAAADIAGTRSSMIKRARSMLDSESFGPGDITELASALATLEFDAGDFRQSRRLFRRALVAPTDNTVAQATWAAPHLHLEIEEKTLEAPTSWEARALRANRAGDWKLATHEADHWQQDQPFASRPGQLGSYEASKGGEFRRGAEFAEKAIRANPREFLLRNNAAFCRLSLGEIDQARVHLAAINQAELSTEQRQVLSATFGLYRFRNGEPERGRELYLTAMNGPDPELRILAGLMLAREEFLIGAPGAAGTFAEAQALLEGLSNPELTAWLEQVDSMQRGRIIRLPTPRGTR